MAEKTGFILHYDMLNNLKLMGADIALEVLSALAQYDQGLNPDKLSPQAQFAFNAYVPTLKKAKKRWETSVKNGNQNKPRDNLDKINKELFEPSDNLDEPSKDLAEPSDNLDEPRGGLGQCVNVNVNVNDNVNDNVNETVTENVGEESPGEIDLKNPEKLFLHYWQHNPDVFNYMAGIEKPRDWENYWATSPPTCEEVKRAMENCMADFREGFLKRKYIPLKPDKFVLNGWIHRCQEREKPEKSTPTKEEEEDMRESLKGVFD